MLRSNYRTILEDTPCHLNDGLTTIHFPDIHISFFRMLLDFLYSGQTYVPVDELEQLQDLLALLQIKPNIWRSGDSKEDIVKSKSNLIFAPIPSQTSLQQQQKIVIPLCKLDTLFLIIIFYLKICCVYTMQVGSQQRRDFMTMKL